MAERRPCGHLGGTALGLMWPQEVRGRAGHAFVPGERWPFLKADTALQVPHTGEQRGGGRGGASSSFPWSRPLCTAALIENPRSASPFLYRIRGCSAVVQ